MLSVDQTIEHGVADEVGRVSDLAAVPQRQSPPSGKHGKQSPQAELARVYGGASAPPDRVRARICKGVWHEAKNVSIRVPHADLDPRPIGASC